MMKVRSRRAFLKRAQAGAVGAAAMAAPRRVARAHRANDRLTVGIIGCGGRGRQLGELFAQEPDVVVAAVCDPDRTRLSRAQTQLGATHAESDLRRILDNKNVDAVIIAACDHWHAPAAILACQAGKHVYVEKPCSHSIREGRLMLAAARQHKRVMQHGTQSRSNPLFREAVELLRVGSIGKVLVAKAVNSQRRANIGYARPASPPGHLDYDLWVGPAAWMPYQSNFVHYNWHWFYNFGTGDIGNDGVHSIDIARWGLGVTTHPSFVAGYGSKLFFDDDQQFPDTYQITFEYPGNGGGGGKRVLIYEQRIWSPYREDEDGNSLFFYGTDGMLTVGRSGIRVMGKDNRLVKHVAPAKVEERHQRDFVKAIRTTDRPCADIEVGHLSSTLCHLGNIVARTGHAVRFDPNAETILSPDAATPLVSRTYRDGHWAVPDRA